MLRSEPRWLLALAGPAVSRLALVLAALAGAAGCDGGIGGLPSLGGEADLGGGGGSPRADLGVRDLSHPPAGDAGSGGGGDGLPCAVEVILMNSCWSCHGRVPSGGAPMSLVTLADLTAPSQVDPRSSSAQRSLARMSSASSPMPPRPASAVPAADVTTFANWVAAGSPAGNCGGSGPDAGVGGGGSDPLNAAPTCTSNSTFRGGRSANMDPGQACIACHSRGGGPGFQIAGTVYATGHEPDNCNGATGPAAGVASAQIVITDARNQVVKIPVSTPSGNFSWNSVAQRLTLPYTAKVVWQGRTRAMATPQTSGDCNGCHTQKGTSSKQGAAPAPGRITLPQ